MENNKDKTKSDYKPDITNYDYVWGSDQDEYVKNDQTADEETKQEIEISEK